LLYQTLVGIWPGLPLSGEPLENFVRRVNEYMLKAGREAKVRTSWLNPHEAYEAATRHFIAKLFDPPNRPFVDDLNRFVGSLTGHGMWNSLAQLVLKIASPGVADFYQGTELWNYTLVDPDNRGPVDFALRQRLLNSLQRGWAEAHEAGERAAATGAATPMRAYLAELLDQRQDGRLKLLVTWRGLALRRDHWQVLLHGDYIPLEASGPQSPHVVALARQYEGRFVLAVVPRLTVGLTGFGGPPPLAEVWQDTTIPLPAPLRGATLENALTGQRVQVPPHEQGLTLARALEDLPVAILLGP